MKRAILDVDVFGSCAIFRLNERFLTDALGVSRTPLREALTLLEREGFVRTVPRRGFFVARKSKSEIIEMIQMWAALESMAARLATLRATSSELAGLREWIGEYRSDAVQAKLSEYPEINVAFHSEIVRIAGSDLLTKSVTDIFHHVRAIRRSTIPLGDRASRSVTDHIAIVHALESRNTELAERLVREHSLGLSTFVHLHCDYLD